MSLPLTEFSLTNIYIRLHEHIDSKGYMAWYKEQAKFVNTVYEKCKTYEQLQQFDFSPYAANVLRRKNKVIGCDSEGARLWEIEWTGPMKNS